MANPYELLLRHPDLLTADTLILAAHADLPSQWLALFKQSQAQLLTWDWLTAEAHHSVPAQVSFALPQPELINQAKQIILFWPKAKPLALALVSLIANQHQHCYVIGENDAGGKSIGKNVQALAQAEKLDAARHCSLWQLELAPQQGFNWLKLAQAFNHQAHTFLTLPGVFNHGKLDLGTALLLEHVPAPSQGKLLDLGCGSGVIGLSFKAQAPALEVTLVDVDALALQSARLNSARLNLAVNVQASDGLAELDTKFDFIFTNPPFHQGKNTTYHFAQNLLTTARSHLVADGQLWLVANNHLPYEEWAKEHFSQVELMAQGRGFKLLMMAL